MLQTLESSISLQVSFTTCHTFALSRPCKQTYDYVMCARGARTLFLLPVLVTREKVRDLIASLKKDAVQDPGGSALSRMRISLGGLLGGEKLVAWVAAFAVRRMCCYVPCLVHFSQLRHKRGTISVFVGMHVLCVLLPACGAKTQSAICM